MNTRTWITLTAVLTVAALLTNCAPAARQAVQPERVEATQVVAVERVVEVAAETVVEMAPTAAAPQEAPATPAPTVAAPQDIAGVAPLTAGRPNRLIVKNAEVKLLVADTEVAIDRITQVVADAGGYIISSRVWYQEWYEENYKYHK